MTLTDRPRSGIRSKDSSIKKQGAISCLVYRYAAFLMKFIFRINGGLVVKGREKIPAEGGVIIASNHLSYLDPPLLGAVAPRRATFMARKGLFSIPLLGWFISYYAFSVDREKTMPSTIKNSVKRLKNGELLIIFPEGRRSETGKLLEARRGIGIIEQMSKAAVVPALITGTDKALLFGARWLKRARVTVTFDNPIFPSAIYSEGKQSYEEITQKIMGAIRELKKHHGNTDM
ncbi:MAG TPA: 1-acyl-sn-glycerol-3-phosphate acyltransferase [Nitrospirae bacterium]|nr:1-acyl-sn-glycerol-3-phosphate acyltransferase [Nitrospirota bacterium]